MAASRYVVGIDLGTTNSAARLRRHRRRRADEARPTVLPIPQLVQPGQVEARPLLPSFLYLPNPEELPAGSLKLPWDASRDFAVGEFARNQGSLVPTRLVASAKSWLCHPGVDRKAPILPWKAPEGGRHAIAARSQLRCTCGISSSRGIRRSPRKSRDNRLERQDVVLTVPASFDAAARELTVEAARAAGSGARHAARGAAGGVLRLDRRQPRRLARTGRGRRRRAGLSTSAAAPPTSRSSRSARRPGNLALTRVAVGDHILLGGDNMDLALAHAMAQGFAAKGTKLDAAQMLMLWHACRAAKEKLFADPKLASAPVTVSVAAAR